MVRITDYFQLMIERNASDLHLSSGACPMFRVAGTMIPVNDQVLTNEQVQALIGEILPERSRAEWEHYHDTDFAYQFNGMARFRCNVFVDHNGSGGVFRLIPSKICSFQESGLPETLKKLCFLTKGLVLVTGPTGSGKSTTLATLIDFINENRKRPRDHD